MCVGDTSFLLQVSAAINSLPQIVDSQPQDVTLHVQVTDHARQLMEKHLRKPFFDGGYAGSVPRMNAADLEEGIAWVDDRFFPIRYEDEALPSVDWVLNVAKAAVLRCAQ